MYTFVCTDISARTTLRVKVLRRHTSTIRMHPLFYLFHDLVGLMVGRATIDLQVIWKFVRISQLINPLPGAEQDQIKGFEKLPRHFSPSPPRVTCPRGSEWGVRHRG